MTWHLKSLQWLAVAVVVLPSLAATAAVKPNPYDKIPNRNVFNLLPIPDRPIVDPPLPPRRPPPKVFITGLVELGGVSKALVEINEPGQPVQRSDPERGVRVDVGLRLAMVFVGSMDVEVHVTIPAVIPRKRSELTNCRCVTRPWDPFSQAGRQDHRPG